MVSREDVAKEAGVSAMTVTRVVLGKGYVSEKTKKKVSDAIEKLGYIPNKLASNFAVGKNAVIAVIVPDLSNPYFMEVASYLMEYAIKFGYTVSVYKASNNDLPPILENLMSNRVSGVVNFSTEFPKKYIDAMANLDIKVIRGSFLENDFKMEVSWKDAIYKAFDKMIENGGKKVLFLSGLSEEYYKVDSRVKDFLSYVTEKGLPLTEDLVIKGNYPYEEPYIVGEQAVDKIIKKGEKFDGLFCINDMMAIGAINGLMRRGYRVPEDVMVVGFDDIMMGKYIFPSLSTISINAKKEASLYLDYITGVDGGKDAFLFAEFIERESTGLKK